MCGIAGIVGREGDAVDRAVQRMTGAMARRGPDDEAFWSDPAGHAHFGFRRLAILDLSPAGRQPMVSADGRSVLVFNGELYNFRELRRRLEAVGVRFRSRSDTEVVLEALARWGTAAIGELNGMFALAWYELAERRLLLARDHAGIKPLYYAKLPKGGVAFASQLDALLEAPDLDPDAIELDVLRLYLRLHHVPPPHGLVRHTHQLAPGHWLRVDAGGRTELRAWWKLPRSPEPDPALRGERALEELQATLDDAVARQLVADVPVGVFLSGGVDSPLVAAAARRERGPDLRAFTIGNPGWGQDESADARAFAGALDVSHNVHDASAADALATLPDVIAAQHEPFADFSIVPTLLVSELARREVTVALSGDGGDELFFGYGRPLSLLRDGAMFRWPWPVRLGLYGAGKYGLGPKRSSVIANRSPADYYFEVNSRVSDGELAELAPGLPPLPADFRVYAFDGYRGQADLASYSRHAEFYGQLQRCLKKVDLASMHHSLEVRTPLLDREVIDLSLRIDPFECMRGGARKAVLVDLLARRVPRSAIPTVKRGFAVPLGTWLRTSLRASVEDTLFDGTLDDAIFDRRALRSYWQDHLTERADHKWGLWTLLAFAWWRRRMKATRRADAPAHAPEVATGELAVTTRILFTIPNFITAGSGFAMLSVVRRLDRSRFAPAICVSRRGGRLEREIEQLGIPLLEAPFTVAAKPYASLPARAWAASAPFRSRGFRLWHSFHYGDDYTEPLIARLAGARHWIYTKKNMNWKQRAWHARSVLASRIAAQNMDMLRQFFASPLYRGKARLVPRGVDTAVFQPGRAPRFGIRGRVPPGATTVVSVAALVPVKGHVALLEAAARVPQIALVLAGGPLDSDHAASLRSRAEALGIAERVLFLGGIDDVPALLAEADLFCLPSRSEGSPVALLEAMACGCACVASDVSGVHDVIEHERSGWLTPAGDVAALARALEQLASDAALRARLGHAARERIAEHYTIEREVAAHVALYEELAG